MHFKDPFESKYQLLINGIEKIIIKGLHNQKAFIHYSQTIRDVYESSEDYSPTKKVEMLIGDMEANKKLSPIVTQLFLRGKTLDISLVFISYSCFNVPKTIRLNATHYVIIKIPNKREIQQKASNHSSEIEFKDFMKLYKGYTKEQFSLLVKDITLPSDNPLRFRKNLL